MESLTEGQVKLIGVSGVYRGMEFLISKDDYIIGRHPESDLVLKESTISARHCRIQKIEGRYMLTDLDSTNGTYLNGEKVKQSLMRHDDRVQFDVYEFIFHNPEDVTRTVISQAPKELRISEKDQTVAIPTATPDEPLPAQKTILSSTSEKKEEPPPFKKRGQVPGLLLGLILGFAISLGGIMLVVMLRAGSFQASLLRTIALSLPLYYLHTSWKLIQWDWMQILVLILVLAGPIIAGMVGSMVNRRRGFGFSLGFSCWYVFLALIAQLVAMKFDIKTWASGYEMPGLAIQPGVLNIFVSLIYIILVVFILHAIGSLFAKKK